MRFAILASSFRETEKIGGIFMSLMTGMMLGIFIVR
jgi:hypothetical protein